jgi:hypothetical protein
MALTFFRSLRHKMNAEGPVLESLTRRLSETPQDFFAEPIIGQSGQVSVAAVAGDLIRMLGGSPEPAELASFTGVEQKRDRNRLAIALLLCWLLSDNWFKEAQLNASSVVELLDEQSREFSTQVSAQKFVNDPDRREELARLVLARLGYRPAGETLAQAQDRLTTLNSAERARVMKAAQVAEKRARDIREALARKAAEESADKWSRE